MASILNPNLTVEQAGDILNRIIHTLGASEAVAIINPRQLGVLTGQLARDVLEGIEAHPDEV